MHEYRHGLWSAALSISMLGLVLLTTSGSAQQNKEIATSESQKTLFRLATAEWSEPYNGPLGYPKGAQRASLGIDPRTAVRPTTRDSPRDPASRYTGTRILNMPLCYEGKLLTLLGANGSHWSLAITSSFRRRSLTVGRQVRAEMRSCSSDATGRLTSISLSASSR